MRTTRTLFACLATASTVALTAGCSSDLANTMGRDGASARISDVEARLDADRGRMSNVDATGRPGNLRVRQGLYVGDDGFRTGNGDPLPARFQGSDGISMKLGEPLNVVRFASFLHEQTGLRVDIRDLYAQSMGGEESEETQDATADSTSGGPIPMDGDQGAESGDQSDADDTPAQAVGSRMSRGQMPHPAEMVVLIDYSGSLSGLLDHVAGQIGADWSYQGGRIKFLGPQTRTYTLWALPDTMEIETSIGDGGSAESFGTSSQPTTRSTRELAYWEDLRDNLATMLPDAPGTRFAINRSAGTITVTGFQATHERVSDYIRTENDRLSRQVAVKIDVIAFSATDSATRSADIDAVFNRAVSGFNLNLSGADLSTQSAPDFGVDILEDGNNFGPWEGSSALVDALSEVGRSTIVKSASVIAMNDTPTPLTVTTDTAYLESVVTRTDGEGGESTELQTGVVNSGLSMTMTPRIFSDGRITLNYALALNELRNLATFGNAGNQVQLPEVESRNLMQTVNIENGDSIIMASFDDSITRREGSGPFNPAFWGLGGRDGYSQEDTKIIFVMTPVVLENGNMPRAAR